MPDDTESWPEQMLTSNQRVLRHLPNDKHTGNLYDSNHNSNYKTYTFDIKAIPPTHPSTPQGTVRWVRISHLSSTGCNLYAITETGTPQPPS